MSPKRIVVIGDVMLDVIVQPTSPVAPTSDTPANVRLGRGGRPPRTSRSLWPGPGHE